MKARLLTKQFANMLVKQCLPRYHYRRRFLANSQWFGEDRLAELQLREFQNLVRHCYETVVYYRRLMEGLGIGPGDIQKLEDIKRFPIMYKQDILKGGKDLVSTRYSKLLLHKAYTGGTSGPRVGLYRDVNSIAEEHSYVRRQFDWAGVSSSDRCGYLTWRSVTDTNSDCRKAYLYDPFMKELILSTFHLSPERVEEYAEAIKRYGVKCLVGYPSAIFVMAREVIDKGLSLNLKAVLTTSETLGGQQRRTIEEAFNCGVFDFYGSAERVCYIHTCEQGSYHIIPEYGLTELVRAEWPNEDCHRIVATGFVNKAMPLIRYDTGDLVKLSDRRCGCGREFRVVSRIVGRETKFVTTKEGRTMGLTALGRLFKNTLLEVNRLPVFESRIVFDEDESGIELEYTPGKGFKQEDRERLRWVVEKHLPSELGVQVKAVSKMERTGSGKCISIASP